jgi:hypothetical protein
MKSLWLVRVDEGEERRASVDTLWILCDWWELTRVNRGGWVLILYESSVISECLWGWREEGECGYFINPLWLVRVAEGEEKAGECGYFLSPLWLVRVDEGEERRVSVDSLWALCDWWELMRVKRGGVSVDTLWTLCDWWELMRVKRGGWVWILYEFSVIGESWWGMKREGVSVDTLWGFCDWWELMRVKRGGWVWILYEPPSHWVMNFCPAVTRAV